MKTNKKVIILLIICFSLEITASGQKLCIVDTGWAANSVNAVIFRKNSIVSFKDIQYTAYYNPEGYLCLAKRLLNTDSWEINHTNFRGNVTDAHNSISIMVDGDGYLHVAFDHHNSPLKYLRSIEPGSLVLDTATSMVGDLEAIVTYPEFFYFPNGDLLFLYRSGESGNGNLVMNYFHTKQKTWERISNSLIDGEGQRNAYWQAFVDAKGSIHLSWVWRETPDVASNHDMCYAVSSDRGKTWKNSQGIKYTLPITFENAEVVWKIPQGSELINQTSMFSDTKGNPYIVTFFKRAKYEKVQFQLVYFTNKKWDCIQVSNRLSSFSLSGVGTKKIPVSRPQIIISETKTGKTAYILFRDSDRGNRVSLAYCLDFPNGNWKIADLTDFSVGDWEPTYDTELWKNNKLLNVFVEFVGQGDNETQTATSPQPIYILEFDENSIK